MRLSDLNAVLVRHEEPDGLRYTSNMKGAQGIQLDCPCGEGHALLLWFSNPLDAVPVPIHIHPMARWQRMGEDVASLTLAPSVDAHCWHGFIKNGEIC